MNFTKTLLFSTLLLAATATLSVGQGRFSLSATAAPTWRNFDYSAEFPTMIPSNGDMAGYNYRGKDNGGTLGLTASYQFHPSWSVSTGLWYNRSMGYRDFRAYLNGNAVGYESTSRQVFNTLQVPVLINFSPTRHRLSPYLSAGFLMSMNYKSLTRSPNSNDAPTVTHSQKLDTYAMVGAGVQYQVSSRWSLIVQPTALYRLRIPATERGSGSFSSIRNYRDWQLGVQAQVKYTF